LYVCYKQCQQPWCGVLKEHPLFSA
jgi:hypothetical protein